MQGILDNHKTQFFGTRRIRNNKRINASDNFESQLKSIIDDNIEDNKDKSDNQQYEASFKLAPRKRK
jgi:hypothetical protein